MSRGASSPAPYAHTPGTPRSYPGYPDMARQSTPSQHPRGGSDPSGYPAYAQSVAPHPSVQTYPHGYPPQYAHHPRNPIPTGSYPYAGSQVMSHAGPSMQHQPYPGMEGTAADRSSSSRYECTYCGKGFTRPSSLKVCSRFPPLGQPYRACFILRDFLCLQIHLNTHTGEKRECLAYILTANE